MPLKRFVKWLVAFPTNSRCPVPDTAWHRHARLNKALKYLEFQRELLCLVHGADRYDQDQHRTHRAILRLRPSRIPAAMRPNGACVGDRRSPTGRVHLIRRIERPAADLTFWANIAAPRGCPSGDPY